MVCHLFGANPSPKWWFIVTFWTLRNKFLGNFDQNIWYFFQWNALETGLLKLTTKKTQQLCLSTLCEGNQNTSKLTLLSLNVDRVSLSWCHQLFTYSVRSDGRGQKLSSGNCNCPKRDKQIEGWLRGHLGRWMDRQDRQADREVNLSLPPILPYQRWRKAHTFWCGNHYQWVTSFWSYYRDSFVYAPSAMQDDVTL